MSVNAKSAIFIYHGAAYSAVSSFNFSFRILISAYYIAVKAARGRNTVCIKNPL